MGQKRQIDFGGRPFSIETGKVAKQANGSVMVQYGETVVLVTAVASEKKREGLDFIPLTVNYLEMTYAAGRIPGGFFKREGRPSDRETLISRFITAVDIERVRSVHASGRKREHLEFSGRGTIAC